MDPQKAPADESPHLTVPQLAARWQTTKKAIYNMRSEGTAPPCFKRGRNLMFPLSAVEAYEASALHDRPLTSNLAA